MAVWKNEREVERLRDRPEAVRDLAAGILLRRPEPHALTDWEAYEFLPDIARATWRQTYTDSQIEKLLEIEFLSRIIERWDGVSTRIVLLRCHEARLDLDEDDEAEIVALHGRSPQRIYGRDLFKLLRCARRLHYA